MKRNINALFHLSPIQARNKLPGCVDQQQKPFHLQTAKAGGPDAGGGSDVAERGCEKRVLDGRPNSETLLRTPSSKPAPSENASEQEYPFDDDLAAKLGVKWDKQLPVGQARALVKNRMIGMKSLQDGVTWKGWPWSEEAHLRLRRAMTTKALDPVTFEVLERSSVEVQRLLVTGNFLAVKEEWRALLLESMQTSKSAGLMNVPVEVLQKFVLVVYRCERFNSVTIQTSFTRDGFSSASKCSFPKRTRSSNFLFLLKIFDILNALYRL